MHHRHSLIQKHIAAWCLLQLQWRHSTIFQESQTQSNSIKSSGKCFGLARILHFLQASLNCRPATSHGVQVTYAKGWGSFKSPTEVEVAGLDGNNQTISTKNVIIAAGSEVINLPGVTIDEER